MHYRLIHSGVLSLNECGQVYECRPKCVDNLNVRFKIVIACSTGSKKSRENSASYKLYMAREHRIDQHWGRRNTGVEDNLAKSRFWTDELGKHLIVPSRVGKAYMLKLVQFGG
jgi:hypothetical protein